MEDFFENSFAITPKVRDRLKMVTLGIALHCAAPSPGLCSVVAAG